LQLETNIAARDWFDIPSCDLLWCADKARRLEKAGPVSNKDMLEVYRELRSERAAKRKKVENIRLLDMGDKPATSEEISEILSEWKKNEKNEQTT